MFGLWSKRPFARPATTPFAAQIQRDSWWVVFWLALFVALLSYLSPRLPLERLDNVIYDFQLRLQPFPERAEQSPPIALIIIDDASLKSLGHWPWRRKVYADLLQHLEQAKAVGIDLLFTNTNPAYPDDDALLAAAIQAHGRVVLPVFVDKAQRLEQPIEPLLAATAGLGFINIEPDADGVVRHLRLYRDLGGPNYEQKSPRSQPKQPSPALGDENATAPSAPSLIAKRPATPPQTNNSRSVSGSPKLDPTDPSTDPTHHNNSIVPSPIISPQNSLPNNPLSKSQAQVKQQLHGLQYQAASDYSPQTISHFSTALLAVTDDRSLLTDYDSHYKRRHLIPFAGPLGSFPTYSFAKVLAGDYPPDTFKDKYVLIGAWSSGLGDYYPTPFSSTENTSMSGVEILANATNNLLFNNWIHKAPTWVSALANILPVIFIGVGLRRLSPRYAFFGTSLVIAALFVGNWLLLHGFALWIPIGSALVGSIISYPLWYWRSQETVLRYVDKQLSDLRQHNPGLSQALDISEVELTLPARLNHLYKAIELLREAEQRRVETLNFISHDMRAPQNSILALVEVERQQAKQRTKQLANTQAALRATADPVIEAEREQFFKRLEHYAANTLNLVDDFIDLARVESSAFELRPLILNELANQAIDDVWAIATKKDITLRYDEPDKTVWVQGHNSFLLRVLTNLLDNAIKYSPEHTTIFCSLTTQKDKAIIRIQDQGWGIPKEELPHIFSAFKRVHTDRRENPKGTGLGLAFVHTVIERHRGHIKVDSTPNQGTIFTIYLPLMN